MFERARSGPRSSNVLRRAALAGDIAADAASLAHGDLLDLRIELGPYAMLAERSWQFNAGVTARGLDLDIGMLHLDRSYDANTVRN